MKQSIYLEKRIPRARKLTCRFYAGEFTDCTKASGRTSPSAVYNALILDARLRQALVTVRSLGARGLQVAALEHTTVPTFASRWCQRSIVCPADEGTEAYLTYLENVLNYTGARVVIPSSDGTIALLRQHRKRLESHTHLALASEQAMTIAVNKEQTLAIAHQLGLGIPEGVTVGSLDEIPEALRDVGLPAVVKPVESWLWASSRAQDSSRA